MAQETIDSSAALDPKSKEFGEGFALDALDNTRRYFETVGHIDPTAMICMTRDADTGEELDGTVIGIMPVAHLFNINDPNHKTVLAGALRHVAKKSGAVGIAWITEAWTLNFEGLSAEEARREADKWRNRYQDHPDRKEVVSVALEHVSFGQRLYRAEITEKDGKRYLGLFEQPIEAKDGEKWGGRFVNMLPHHEAH